MLLLHYTSSFDEYFPGFARPPFEFRWGGFGVHLFFMISGYVVFWTAHACKGPLDFAAMRFSRLYPTYWAALVLGIVIVYASHTESLFRSPAELLVNFTMVQRLVGVRSFDGAYWSLSVELLFYLFIVFVMLLTGPTFKGPWLRRLLWLWIALSVAIVLVGSGHPSGATHALEIGTAAQFAPLFAVGLLLYASEGRITGELSLAAVVAVLNTAVVEGIAAGGVVALLVFVFAWTAHTRDVRVLRWRPMLWLGSISYPLYLVHQNLGYVVLSHTTPTIGRIPALGLAIFLALLSGWVIHRTIEIPVSGALRRWLRRRLAAARGAP